MSLTYRALARVDARASFPGAPSKLMCKDDSNMLGLKAKSGRGLGGELCALQSPKSGKLRPAAAQLAGLGNCFLCPGVGWLQPPLLLLS